MSAASVYGNGWQIDTTEEDVLCLRFFESVDGDWVLRTSVSMPTHRAQEFASEIEYQTHCRPAEVSGNLPLGKRMIYAEPIVGGAYLSHGK